MRRLCARSSRLTAAAHTPSSCRPVPACSAHACVTALLLLLLLLLIIPPAARKFDEVQKAYAILCDKSARGALDDYLE